LIEWCFKKEFHKKFREAKDKTFTEVEMEIKRKGLHSYDLLNNDKYVGYIRTI